MDWMLSRVRILLIAIALEEEMWKLESNKRNDMFQGLSHRESALPAPKPDISYFTFNYARTSLLVHLQTTFCS